MIKIAFFTLDTGKQPFVDWQKDLDTTTRSIVIERIARVRLGNFGDCKYIRDGALWELRISYGPGYRIYFGKEGTTVIVLLVGGNKRSQRGDIEKAKRYWIAYKELSYG